MPDTPKAGDTRDSQIVEIRERMSHAQEAWKAIRDEAKTDMLCVAGRTWEAFDPKGMQQRRAANRPMISADELGQYINQVVNDVRANPRSVKFSPVGNGANDKAAEFYADKMREIEYRSHAHTAYTTAFQDAVQRSYGYVRVLTKYANHRSEEQDIWIEPVANPDMVLVDPEGMRPDSSDIQWAFVYETWKQAEFKRRFPKAKQTDFSRWMAEAPQWVKSDTILVAEHWKIRTKARKLLLVQPAAPPAQPGSPLGLQGAPAPVRLFEDEYEPEAYPGASVRELRTVDYPQVYQCLTNGLEILEETDWIGQYIPIASCYGKILYLDDGGGSERVILSMTRLARDPQQLYNYYRTCEAELIGMTPKFPYFVYEGQLDPQEHTNLQKSLHEPVAVIRVKPTVEGVPANTVLSFPSRQPYEPPIQGLEIGAESARRAIQAAMGSNFLPTMAQQRNEKSGKALERIQETSQKGSFHFNDHYNDMIRHVGVICEDLIDKVYDTPREVGIRKPNETAEMVRINQPGGISTKGDYLVTVSTGPASDSQREAANEFADSLVGSPQIAQVIGPEKAQKLLALAIKLKNIGPLGDEMAQVIDPSLAQDDQADPAMLKQQLAETQAKLQQLEQIAQQMHQAIETKQVEQQAQIEKARLDNETRVKIAEIGAQTSIATAQIKEGMEEYKLRVQHLEEILGHKVDLTMQAREFQHEDHMADKTQMHEQQIAVHQRESAKEQTMMKAQQPKGNRSGA